MSEKYFEETDMVPFEGMLVPVPRGRYKLLRERYGDRYIYPKEFDPYKMRHGFYDVHTPYTEYKKRFLRTVDQLPKDKQIVLVGDGLLFDDFFNKFKGAKADKLAMVEEIYPIKTVKGLNCKKLSELDKDRDFPVICCTDIRKAEKTLKEFGFEEYYVALEDRSVLQRANLSFYQRDKYYQVKH